jgi:hypothetical protein
LEPEWRPRALCRAMQSTLGSVGLSAFCQLTVVPEHVWRRFNDQTKLRGDHKELW